MFNLPNFTQFTIPEAPKIPSAYSYSDTQFEFLKEFIEEYESTLDSEHEVGLLLTNFGQSVLMQVTEIDYRMPVLMIFKGYVNGSKSTLIQHVNQLSFLLTSVSKDPERPKQKIGFATEHEE